MKTDRASGRIRVYLACGAAICCLLLWAAGCGGAPETGAAEEQPLMEESLEGLILEGEGPIPARLIYGSSNVLSNEEDRYVLEEISQELDRLLELAGQLDEFVIDEPAAADGFAP